MDAVENRPPRPVIGNGSQQVAYFNVNIGVKEVNIHICRCLVTLAHRQGHIATSGRAVIPGTARLSPHPWIVGAASTSFKNRNIALY
ncbi:hypothetical protein [Methylomagnum sp.]